MSDTTTTEAPQAPDDLTQMLLDDVLGGLNPDAPVQPQAPAAAPEQAPTAKDAQAESGKPAETAPEQARDEQGRFAPQAPSADAAPVWSGQEDAGKAFANLTKELRETQRELAYLRGLATATQPKPAEQKPVADVDPKPDPSKYTDDQTYWDDVLAWNRREAKREALAEVMPILEPLKNQTAEDAWDRSMGAAQKRAGADWDALVAWTNGMQSLSKGFASDLAAAKDPGLFAEKAWRASTGKQPAPTITTPQPAPQKTPSPTAGVFDLNDPQQREAAIRVLAQQAAANRDTPQTPPAMRGVGGGSAAPGADANDITPESVRAMRDPHKLASLGARVFGDFLGVAEDSGEDWPPAK